MSARRLDLIEILLQLRDWAAEVYPHYHPSKIVLTLQHGEKTERVCLPLPINGRPVSQPPADEPDNLNDCGRDILALLEERGERMTGDAIRGALQERGQLHGDSTITRTLADLGPQNRKVLSNRRDSYGRGYGLADWG